MDPTEGRHWRFTGQVQGVGFRWRARELALRHGLVGWVANRPDGSVVVEAEGAPQALDAFLNELSGAMGSHIEELAAYSLPALGRYGEFTVEHDK